MRRVIVVVLALLAFAVALAGALAGRGRELALGVHTLRPDDLTLQQARALGARYVVQVFSWREIEPTRGEFHWEYTDWLLRAAEYYDLRIVARLDEPPNWAAPTSGALSAPPRDPEEFAAFAGAVAARYRGRMAAYIIWNEPNLAREWGRQRPDPAGYARLLALAAQRVRRADPSARIVSAGLASTDERSEVALDDREFLKQLYAAGAGPSFDILGAHPYPFANPPQDPRGAHQGLNFARLLDLRDLMVASGDATKPIWITEFGYTTQSPTEVELQVSEQQQADYLARAFEAAREQWDWLQLFTVWNLSGGLAPSDEKAGYSLLHADGSLKPAYSVLAAMPKSSALAAQGLKFQGLLKPASPQLQVPVLARDAPVHLGDSEYPAPWVPLYANRNPSGRWTGQFYLRPADLAERGDWQLAVELMQANDLDGRVLVNGQPVDPEFLPVEDFTSIWVTARFRVPARSLREGQNEVSIQVGKLFPVFQQLGFTWDDLQIRNLRLTPP